MELEPRFIEFQKKNKGYAGRKLGRELDWTILQGDSRKLSSILSENGVVTVTSPPYGDVMQRDRHDEPSGLSDRDRALLMRHGGSYGTDNTANIGNLPDRPLVITSPPYADAINATTKGGIDWNKCAEGPRPDKQIGNLPDKPITVTSPPYENQELKVAVNFHIPITGAKNSKGTSSLLANQGYQTDGQIGSEKSETYLTAMSQVYQEVGKISDVIAVVTKNPTQGGKLRRLDLDTIALLEQTGWNILCVHKALLFTEHETQDLFGQKHKKVKGRMSFFKRLSYQRGNAVARFEDIIIATK